MKVSMPAFSVLVLTIFTITGCKKDADNNEAVKQGVMKYLSKRNDLGAMDVTVPSVQFRGNEADAKVHFQAKNNSSPAASMEMMYVLERKGDGWEVKGRSSAGGAPHGSMPPDAGGAAPNGTPLPPGHPSLPPSQAAPQGMPELPQIPPHK